MGRLPAARAPGSDPAHRLRAYGRGRPIAAGCASADAATASAADLGRRTPVRGGGLGGVCGALVVAAGLLWGASALAWAPPGRAAADSAVGGASAPSALTGVALLALAGIAAVVATSGLARRFVGGLLGVAGAVVVVATAAAWAAATAVIGVGPLLAVGGGLLLVVAAGAVVVREPRLARLGARYAAAGTRATHADPDRAAWAALDEGRDPTADAVAATTADRSADSAADRAADRADDPVFDPATGPAEDAAGKPDDPGGGRGGGAV